MASDLPEDGLRPSQNNSEASVLPNDDGNGLSQGAIWPQALPTLAPWSNLSWGLYLTACIRGQCRFGYSGLDHRWDCQVAMLYSS
jgi:hypothetical protein